MFIDAQALGRQLRQTNTTDPQEDITTDISCGTTANLVSWAKKLALAIDNGNFNVRNITIELPWNAASCILACSSELPKCSMRISSK